MKLTKIYNCVIFYVLAVLAAGVGALLRALIVHLIGLELDLFVTFYPFVMIMAVAGGVGPGILTAIASAVIVLYWVPLTQGEGLTRFDPVTMASTILFLIMAVLISAFAQYYAWTVRKQREKIDQVNKYNRSLFEFSPESLVILDLDGRIIDANGIAAKNQGMSRQQLIGCIYYDFATDPQKAREGFLQTLSKGSISNFPLTICHQNGTKMNTLYNGVVLKDEKNRVIGVLASSRDVTEQNILAEQLKEYGKNLKEKIRVRTQDLQNVNLAAKNVLEDLAAEKLKTEIVRVKEEAILASIGDGIIATGPDRKIILMNKKAEELLGWKVDEAIGKLYDDVVLLEDEEGTFIPPEKKPLHKAFDQGTTTTDTATPNTTSSSITTGGLYILSKNKIKFPVAVTVSPVVLDNEIIGAVEVFRDITKEQAIDKAKTEFVSLASHQLRTPLTSISWYSEMLLKGDVGKVSPKQQKYLEEIAHGDERMVNLVNTLLNVSRIETGTFKIESEPTDIIALAQNVIDEQKLKIVAKKLVVIKNFAKGVLKISTDPNLLRMVFQNLFSNAVNYTPLGGEIKFSVSADQEKKKIQIKISDTGYGIPKDQQSQIFTKLFRADNIRNKDTSGTGLGLYIVKSIVENFGGKIWFESVEDKGTTFYVTLPLNGTNKKENIKALL